MKKNIISIVLIIILVCIGSYLIYHFTDREVKENKEEPGVTTVSYSIIIDLFETMGIEEYRVKNYVFSNAIINVNDGEDSFEAALVSDKDVALLQLEIVIYDEDGKKITNIDYELKDVLVGEERTLFCFVDADLYHANSFEIKVKND